MVTVITKTIKPSGGDYATFTLAEADAANIGTSADLVANDEAIVFEAYAAVYDERVEVLTGMTTDATRNITFTAASGSEHHGSSSRGVIIDKSGNTTWAVRCRTPYTVFRGLVVRNEYGQTSNYGVWINAGDGKGTRVEQCIVKVQGLFGVLSQPDTVAETTSSDPASVLINNLVEVSGSSSNTALELRGDARQNTFTKAVNNTLVVEDGGTAVDVGSTGGAGLTQAYQLINNLCLGASAFNSYTQSGSGTWVPTGFNNVGGATNPFPSDLQAGNQAWDITKNTRAVSDGNNAIYSSLTYRLTTAGGNDAIDAGIGPDSDSDVPSSDILQHPRWGATTQVGAFQSLYHVWTTMNYSKRIDLDGIVKCGDGKINLVYDTLSVTGATGSDNTPALPVGTTAVWVQVLDQTTAASDWDIYVEIDDSTSVPLVSLGGSSVDDDNTLLGLWKQALEVETSDGTYPRIKATISNAGASDVSTLRVHAIGSTDGPVWS